MDKTKLRYDLALQCALVDILKEQASGTKISDIRGKMLESFKSHYQLYLLMDDSNFEVPDKM